MMRRVASEKVERVEQVGEIELDGDVVQPRLYPV
jgi:hypothetical protein